MSFCSASDHRGIPTASMFFWITSARVRLQRVGATALSTFTE